MILLCSLALAGFTVESEPLGARTEALVVQQQAELLGHPARVVRRYRRGAGWEFVVQIELDERAAAEAAAAALSEALAAPVRVLEEEADGPPAARIEREETGELPDAAPPEVAELLELARRAHGDGELPQDRPLRFRYQRVVDTPEGELSVRAAWLRGEGGLRLDVEVLDGPGTSSTLVVGGEGAWLATPDDLVERDRDHLVELLARHGPEELLAVGLALPGLLEEALSEQARWRFAGDDAALLVEEIGPDGALATRLRLDAESRRVVAVELVDEAGESAWSLSDWREVAAGVVLPFELERRVAGRTIERLDVLELGLDSALDPALFGPPDRPARGP